VSRAARCLRQNQRTTDGLLRSQPRICHWWEKIFALERQKILASHRVNNTKSLTVHTIHLPSVTMSNTVAVTNGSDEQKQPACKRVKTNDLLHDILAPHVFDDEKALKDAYASATPYQHGRIEDMFVDGFLEQVLEEVKQNSKVNFKESDLFRVYQSVDLGNLSPESDDAKSMPSLMRLKQAIYSPQYRAFIERLIGFPPNTLTEQVDCAANCHAPGCHLLCHDDVIGNRKVSFIIYLTDKEWTREDGGCLELYPSCSGSNREPQVNPTKTIVPDFNSMAFFQVLPGVSFHAVQEVFGDRPRLSLQGMHT
jgi:Rps23 Pro-64 3,4-dihydroxylase Tpa1-like proline 4-hydroxylase